MADIILDESLCVKLKAYCSFTLLNDDHQVCLAIVNLHCSFNQRSETYKHLSDILPRKVGQLEDILFIRVQSEPDLKLRIRSLSNNYQLK